MIIYLWKIKSNVIWGDHKAGLFTVVAKDMEQATQLKRRLCAKYSVLNTKFMGSFEAEAGQTHAFIVEKT